MGKGKQLSAKGALATMKIKDRVMLGLLAGLVAAIPARLLNNVAYKLGLTDRKYGQMAASLFLPTNKQKVHRRETQIVGGIADRINCGIMGLTITSLLSLTGRDKAVIKGISVTSLAWLTLYGLTTRLGVAPQSRKPLSSLLSFGDHAVLGGLCGWIVAEFGHDALFPDGKQRHTHRQELSVPDMAPAHTPEYAP